MVTLKIVPPSELRGVWETVKHGIMECAHYSCGQWIPEDVYSAIMCGQASLMLCLVDGSYAGNLVLIKKSQHDGNNMHIWAMYVDPLYGQYIDENMARIDELAKQQGCKRITFHSPRKAWERRARRLGFKPTMVIFEKEVSL